VSILPLRLTDLCFSAGGRTIIDRVSLEIGPDQRTIILGANGAGKSVLMRLAHGLLAATAGEVAWNGGDARRVQSRQAMVFQRPVMLRRSALANIEYGLKLAGKARGERRTLALDALWRVGLAHLSDRPARILSVGEQQRLALARAWALTPEVLFLDEPTANLDPGATREVEQIITAIHDSGTKIIMTTHNLGQARRLGDEVIYLHSGRVLERAPAERFFLQPRATEAAAFIKGELPWN